MRVALVCCALSSAISLAGLVVPACAQAATWPLSVSGPSVELGFHQTYSAGDKSYVHSGVDIPASAGLQIFSPLAGTVRYTGAVPSGDSRVGQTGTAGKTMRAVSVEIPDGRVVTLMPFSGVSVKRGQRVGEGAVLGTLAASGDVSSTGTHLHMGLKDGSTYCDPLSLFETVGVSAVEAAVGSSSQEPGTVSGESALAGAQDATAAAPSSDAVSASDSAAAQSDAAVQEDERFDAISSADVAWAPAEQPSFLERVGSWVQTAAQPCVRQACELWAGVRQLASAVGAPAGLVAGVCVAAALAPFAIMRKRTRSFVGNLWRTGIYPLVARRRG